MSEAVKLKYSDEAQFEDDAEGWAKRWNVEFTAAEESVKAWHTDGCDIVDKFLDRRNKSESSSNTTHVNIFTANTQTTRAFLYGKTPQVDVKRRWGDPNDPVARAAAEAYQRLLNTDIERDGDNYTRALKYALHDRLLPGFGLCKLRYVADITSEIIAARYATDETGAESLDEKGEKIESAPGYTKEEKADEDVAIDYIHWKDALWNAGARTFEEIRWFAFREPLTRAGLKKRFRAPFEKAYGEDWEKQINSIPLQSATNDNKDNQVLGKPDPWSRADVWEIWDKENHKVWWYVKGFHEILDDQEDPLGLAGFWPFPMPMVANLTTDAFLPRPDYVLAQDLYEELNTVSSRITALERALIVRGVYNGSMPGINSLLEGSGENELTPIPEWPQFKDGGGIVGQIEWMPLEAVANALTILRDYRKEVLSLIYQVTGMSDILRGESSQNATATEQAIKAKFASVRLQDFQDEFARFASDIQRLKAEIISKHYSDQTIIDRANVKYTVDGQYFEAPQLPPGMQLPEGMAPPVAPALQLMRDKFMWYRIQVKAESVSATDYASMQQERTVAIQTLTQYLTQILPIGQSAPEMLPFLLEMAKWLFTGMRGAQSIEGIFDQAVIAANKMAQNMQQAAAQPKEPDPKVVAAQVKAEAEKAKAGAEVQKSQTDMQAHGQRTMLEMHTARQQSLLETEKLAMEATQAREEHVASMQKNESDIRKDGLHALAEITTAHAKVDVANATANKSRERP